MFHIATCVPIFSKLIRVIFSHILTIGKTHNNPYFALVPVAKPFLALFMYVCISYFIQPKFGLSHKNLFCNAQSSHVFTGVLLS